jgi:hypothetical protein
MRKLLSVFLLTVLLSSIVCATSTDTGVGIGVNVAPVNIAPEVYADLSSRQMLDAFGNPVDSMRGNYIFEGEQLIFNVLGRDENGNSDIDSISVTVGPEQGLGNPKEVVCMENQTQPRNNANLDRFSPGMRFDRDTDKLYKCSLFAETSASMHGAYWVQAEILDNGGLQDLMEVSNFLFFNPTISLDILNADSGIQFGDAEPGETVLSQVIQLESVVEGGVILDVDIKGTDFYDPEPSNAICPTGNVLKLENMRYFARKGTSDSSSSPTADAQGYDVIDYTYQDLIRGSGSDATRITGGDSFDVTFKLTLPDPCVGEFTEGSISFEGTAV